MNLSAILVVVAPDQFATCAAKLDATPGLEVHQRDPATGRLIVTQEAESVSAEVDGLKRIKAMEGIVVAELVYHYFEDDHELITHVPDLDDAAAPHATHVPEFLND